MCLQSTVKIPLHCIDLTCSHCEKIAAAVSHHHVITERLRLQKANINSMIPRGQETNSDIALMQF